MLHYSPIEALYQEGIDALTPAERAARSAGMFAWTRDQIARGIVAEQGPTAPRAIASKLAITIRC